MAGASYTNVLVNMNTDSVAVTNTLVQTTILAGQGLFTMQGGTIDRTDKLIRIVAAGRIGTLTAAPGTLTFTVKVGGVNAAISNAINLNTTAQTNAFWRLELDLVARTIGNSTQCTLFPTGTFTSRAIVGCAAVAAGPAGVVGWQDTAPALGLGFDSTANQLWDLQATWSIANAANTILTHAYSLSLGN